MGFALITRIENWPGAKRSRGRKLELRGGLDGAPHDGIWEMHADDGRRQVPGGWNRIHLEVRDLEAEVERLRAAGVTFRTTEIVTGPGGSRIIIDDPALPKNSRLLRVAGGTDADHADAAGPGAPQARVGPHPFRPGFARPPGPRSDYSDLIRR